jgi:hypothetical protein
MHAVEGVCFYTKQKAVTSRRPTGIRAGAEFKMPTMGAGGPRAAPRLPVSRPKTPPISAHVEPL